MRAHLLHRLHEIGQSFERVVLALHRDQHRVGRAQAVQRQQRQRRRAVEQDEVVVGRDFADRRASSATALRRARPSGASRARAGRRARLRRRRARGSPARGRSRRSATRRARRRSCARPAAPGRRLRASARLSRPAPVVALPCGSRSTSSTRRFIAARLAARLTAVVVLPTPPFWFATAMMRVIALRCRRTMTRWRAASSPGTSSAGVATTRYAGGSCAISSCGMHALHRDEPAAGREMPRGRRDERREVGEGARDDDVERRGRRVVLDARA